MYVCMCMYVFMHVCMCIYMDTYLGVYAEVEDTVSVSFLLLPCVPRSKSGFVASIF